jgi:hypothetical protein
MAHEFRRSRLSFSSHCFTTRERVQNFIMYPNALICLSACFRHFSLGSQFPADFLSMYRSSSCATYASPEEEYFESEFEVSGYDDNAATYAATNSYASAPVSAPPVVFVPNVAAPAFVPRFQPVPMAAVSVPAPSAAVAAASVPVAAAVVPARVESTPASSALPASTAAGAASLADAAAPRLNAGAADCADFMSQPPRPCAPGCPLRHSALARANGTRCGNFSYGKCAKEECDKLHMPKK